MWYIVVLSGLSKKAIEIAERVFLKSLGSVSYGYLTEKKFCFKMIWGLLRRLDLFSDICFITYLMWRHGALNCFDIRVEELFCNTYWSLTVPLSYICVLKIQINSSSRIYFLVKSHIWFIKQCYFTINLSIFGKDELLKYYMDWYWSCKQFRVKKK